MSWVLRIHYVQCGHYLPIGDGIYREVINCNISRGGHISLVEGYNLVV